MPIESEAHNEPHNLEWTNASCGISTVYTIESPERFVTRVFSPPSDRRKHRDRTQMEAYILFSDVVSALGSAKRPGELVAAYLHRRPELGELIETTPAVNPNSGNRIRAWLWAPAHGSIAAREWMKKNRVELST